MFHSLQIPFARHYCFHLRWSRSFIRPTFSSRSRHHAASASQFLLATKKIYSAAGARSLLEPPVAKHEGLVPWWRHRDPGKCWNVERWWPDDADEGETGLAAWDSSERKPLFNKRQSKADGGLGVGRRINVSRHILLVILFRYHETPC